MLEARSSSIRDGQTRSVRVDDSGNRLVIETTDSESGDSVAGRSLDMPEGMSASAYRLEQTESSSAEWAAKFYSDGRARKVGISFDSDGRVTTFMIDERGAVRQIDGPLPDEQDENWDAGGYEQRV